MYLIPIEKQHSEEKQSHQQNQEVKDHQNNLPENSRRSSKICEHGLTCRHHIVDEKQEVSQEIKPLLCLYRNIGVGPEPSRQTPSERRNDFPLRRGSAGWYDVQDRRISGVADGNYRTKKIYDDDQIPRFKARYSYKHNRYLKQKDEITQSPRQREYEMNDYSSSDEFVDTSSSSSGRLDSGYRSNGQIHNNASSSHAAAGYRSRCPQPFLEVSDTDFRAPARHRSGRRSNTRIGNENWVKRKSLDQRQLLHSAKHANRKHKMTALSGDPRKSKKAVKEEDYHRARLLLESQKLDEDTDSDSSEVEFEKQRFRSSTSLRKNLSIIIPSGRADSNMYSNCIRPSATRNMPTTPSTRCIQLDNLVRLETEKHQHLQDFTTDSKGNDTNERLTSIIISKAKLQKLVTRRYNNRRREIPQTPL